MVVFRLIDMDIGNHIRESRKDKQISAKQLSRELDIHVETLRRIERGDRQPSVKMLERIGKALGINFIIN